MPEDIQATDGLTLNSEEADQLNALLDADEAADAASPKATDPTEPEPGPTGETADRPPQEPEETKDSATPDQKPGAQDTAKAEDKQSEEKQEPNKSRYEKERERQDRSWKKLNEDKDALKKREEQIAAKEAEVLAKARALDEQRRMEEAAKPRYTVQELEKAAERWESEGKYDLADTARKEAERLKQNPSLEAQARQQRAQEEFNRAQTLAWNRAAKDVPEIVDKTSPVRQRLEQFLQSNPQILQYTDGPYLASLYVRDSLAASRVPELLKQVEQMQGRIKELEQLTSFPGSGVPQMQRGESDFSSLKTRDMEKALEAEMAALQ